MATSNPCSGLVHPEKRPGSVFSRSISRMAPAAARVAPASMGGTRFRAEGSSGHSTVTAGGVERKKHPGRVIASIARTWAFIVALLRLYSWMTILIRVYVGVATNEPPTRATSAVGHDCTAAWM